MRKKLRLFHHMRTHFVAYLALFFALGGTSAVAAVQALPLNSVGSPQIKNRSIQTVDISRRTVAALRGARGARGFAGPVGATGPAGPAGATGPAGPVGATGATGATGPAGAPGLSGYARATSPPVTVMPGLEGSAFAECPAGTKVLGGGFFATPAGSNLRVTNSTFGISDTTGAPGWLVTMANQGAAAAVIRATVSCAIVP